MLAIKFSEKWDKLGHIDGFTTIRSYTPEKRDYYRDNIGNVFEVQVNGKRFYDAILKNAEIRNPGAMDIKLLEEDTKINGNVNYDWFYRLTSMKEAIFLEFMRY